MKLLTPVQHLLAVLTACVLVFVVKVQDVPLTPLFAALDERSIKDYTPYFPGLRNLTQHEIFSPKYAGKKKVVLLGASAVDAVGCDSTWDKGEPKNVDFTCSIAYRMNAQLQAAGRSDWQVFNLARTGTRLTPMLYVYARLLALNPDIVIFGDDFPWYMGDNAGAGVLDAQQYEFLDSVFGAYPDTAATWGAYQRNLEKNGWHRPGPESVDRSLLQRLRSFFYPPQRASLSDLIVHAFTTLRDVTKKPGPPYTVRFVPFRIWTEKYYPETAHPEAMDPGFGFFQGLDLIASVQRHKGQAFFYYFSPEWDHRNDKRYIGVLNDVYGKYLIDRGIPFGNYVSLALQPMYETYNGFHQTIYGNEVIAARLIADLQANGLLR